MAKANHRPDLAAYRGLFAGSQHRATFDHANHIVLTIGPGEHAATVSCKVAMGPPPHDDSWIPLLELEETDGMGVSRVVDLKADAGLKSVRLTRTPAGMALISGRMQEQIDDYAQFTFLLFGAATKLQGLAPYLHSTLTFAGRILNSASRRTIIRISLPESAGPRSTQGTYTLASPSQVHSGRRLTEVFYTSPRIALSYRFGHNTDQLAPWLSLGTASIVALVLGLVLYGSRSLTTDGTFDSLAAVYLAAPFVIWDLFKTVSTFSIYGRVQSGLLWTSIVTQSLVIALLAASATGMAGIINLGMLWAFAIALAALSGVSAVCGMGLHARGFWQGFICDQQGCTKRLLIRRDRYECHHTGRVMCKLHTSRTCTGCLYYQLTAPADDAEKASPHCL